MPGVMPSCANNCIASNRYTSSSHGFSSDNGQTLPNCNGATDHERGRYHWLLGHIWASAHGLKKHAARSRTRFERSRQRRFDAADVKSKMPAMDLEFVPNAPEQAMSRMRKETDKWARVVDRLGLRVD